jgi:hypothetical protein
MTLTKSDLKLEKQWERKRRERGGYSARGYIVAVPPDMKDMSYRRLERPEGLRAPDFVQELERLALEWGDRRFAHCVRALFELGIVNKRGDRFIRKRGPHATSLKESAKAYAVTKVRALTKDHGLSKWEACAVVAEDLVWEAASFEAAIEQLRRASRPAREGPRAKVNERD